MQLIARHAVVCLVVIAGFEGAIGTAKSAGRGHLVARAAGLVPSQSTISVGRGDGDERSAALAQIIAQSLERQGFHVSDGSGLILEFRIDDSGITTAQPESNVMLQEQGELGDGSATGARVEGRVEPLKERHQRPGRELQIEFFLFEQGQTPIWSATAVAPRSEQDEDRLLGRMVEAAMDAFGKTEDNFFDPLE